MKERPTVADLFEDEWELVPIETDKWFHPTPATDRNPVKSPMEESKPVKPNRVLQLIKSFDKEKKVGD